MHIFIAFIISMCLFASFHPVRKTPRNEIQLNVGNEIKLTTNSINYNPIAIKENVTSLSDLQYKNITKQNFDYSCGSAALATLLNYYLGENLTERQVINGLMVYGNKQKINERRAFSLLDMKKFVNKLGYNGAGYKADFKDLLELKRPCIVPIEFLGYRHFTVLKGIHQNHIFLADPFRGNTSYTIPAFKKMWYENVIFMADRKGAAGLNALKLTEEDLRFVDEDSIDDLLSIYGPVIHMPDERDFFFTLPDEYQKYEH